MSTRKRSWRRLARGVTAAGVGAALALIYRQRRLRARQQPRIDPQSLILALEPTDAPPVTLEGGVNFRDIGGCRTADGGRIRRGLIYRSGTLDALSDAGQQMLLDLGVQQVFDLRTPEEAERRPDRLPPGIAYRSFAIGAGGSTLSTLLAFMRQIDELPALVRQRYTRSLADDAAIYAGVIGALAEQHEGAAIVHCTAGKDRTGMTVALLLSALGVPDETIAVDYSQSNHAYPVYYQDLAAQLAPLRRIGIYADDLSAILVSDPAYIRALLEAVRTQYGGAAAYLQAAGLRADALDRLRARLVEPAT